MAGKTNNNLILLLNPITEFTIVFAIISDVSFSTKQNLKTVTLIP